MRILWFSLSPSLYKSTSKGYNGIGWIASLERQIREINSIDLGIAFWHSDKEFKVQKKNVCYYPLNKDYSLENKWNKFIFSKKQDEKELHKFIQVIQDFKPDVIHIFGSESNFGLISEKTNIPVVIHIQGIIHPYVNAWFPPGMSSNSFFRKNGLHLQRIYRYWWNLHNNIFMANREINILKHCKYYMGRTDWDKRMTDLLSNEMHYFECGEVLRTIFYENQHKWRYKKKDKVIIQSTISPAFYKGYDLVLKTAKLLKEFTDVPFEWRVFGVKDPSFLEKSVKIKGKEVNVVNEGIATADQLAESILESDLYVHPSYIDNSPNSVCEAQIIGIPVIACNVGGLSSLIKHNETGILIPTNDPYTLASLIKEYNSAPERFIKIGEDGAKVAIERHDTDKIVKQLIDIYRLIINNNMPTNETT